MEWASSKTKRETLKQFYVVKMAAVQWLELQLLFRVLLVNNHGQNFVFFLASFQLLLRGGSKTKG